MIRLVAHVHTWYSYDCLMKPRRLVTLLNANRIDVALIVDHGSFAGSIEARAWAAETNLRVRIPVAAEMCTEYGDVIVIFEDVPAGRVEQFEKWQSLERIARDNRGVIWLPHPYKSHTNIETLAMGADVIEVFNARCSAEENQSAAELCRRLGKVPAYGADAHTYRELWSAVAQTAPTGLLLDVFRQVPTCPTRTVTPYSLIALTQIIKGLKLRKAKLIATATLKYGRMRIRECQRARQNHGSRWFW